MFMENNFEEAFSETVTLLKILTTTPMTTAEAERCFSTLKIIKPFLRNTITQERLNALAMMSMEKTLVTEMTDFNRKDIEKCAGQKERRSSATGQCLGNITVCCVVFRFCECDNLLSLLFAYAVRWVY